MTTRQPVVLVVDDEAGHPRPGGPRRGAPWLPSRQGTPIAGMTSETERFVVTSPWPGNVRQLRNAIERACMMAEGELLGVRDFGTRGPASAAAPAIALRPPPNDRLDDHERHILRVLQEAAGNKSEAAKLLGISRRAFYRKLDRHRLARRENGDEKDAGLET